MYVQYYSHYSNEPLNKQLILICMSSMKWKYRLFVWSGETNLNQCGFLSCPVLHYETGVWLFLDSLDINTLDLEINIPDI